MSDCEHIKLLLGPFDDGELEPHEMEDVALHIVECAECKSALEDYRALGVALRGIAPHPSLAGFAEAVQGRIQRIRPSIIVRIRRRFGALAESLGAAAAMGSVAAAAAVLTAMVVTPYARQVVRHDAPSQNLAMMPQPPDVRPTKVALSPQPSIGANEDVAQMLDPQNDAAQNSEAVISQLEADSPSVALWNEPQTKTTVIWVPNQP